MADLDLAGLERELADMGSRSLSLIARAVNRAGTAGKTAMVKAVAADLGIAQKEVNKALQVDQATRSRATFTIIISGKRLRLIAFGARGPEPSRGKGHGVTYRLPTGRGRAPHAFITTVGTGQHRGVFARKGSRRFPIVELRGPSIPHVFEKYLPVGQEAAQAALLTTLRHDIDFARSGAGEGA